MSYEDYDLNPVRLALDLASLADGTLSLTGLLARQELMLTDHGYPARVIVPALPGVHNTKWVRSIEFRSS